MLYQALRSAAGVALRWYYSDVMIQGHEYVPARGPVLIVANHPNALVDALLVVTSVHRRVLLTAKATLFEHPLLAPILGAVGVVPLRRAKDERTAAREGVAVSRNADAFRMVTEALRLERAVLVFPEGISHDAPSLAPLKTGAARMALEAQRAGVRAMRVLPVGLVYEEKETPRSRVLVRIGDSIDIDTWCAEHPTADAALLTGEINARLHRVTLNFASAERAERAVRVARALAALAEEPPSLAHGGTFVSEAEIAARVEAATEGLENAPTALVDATDAFTTRLAALETSLTERGAALADARISLRVRHGTRFVLRETAISIVALPIAAVGRVTHWLPIRIVRSIAMRTADNSSSRDQPAMRTIVLGLVILSLWYGLLAMLITGWLGGVAAVVALVGIFAAAQIDLRLDDRLNLVLRRAKTYLALRRDPRLRAHVLEEVDALLEQAIGLEQELTSVKRR
ncbi:MAG: lysophospholipid acyltransferase family protein [bacterium]